MLNAIIIEDERPAMEVLVQALSEINAEVQVEAVLTTVKESIEYLSTGPAIDLIFSDVQLPDGISFEIFKKISVQIPVIFVTGYDEFMMNAFTFNGIDYLLKPIDKKELENALLKYHSFEKHFSAQTNKINHLVRNYETRKKNRLVVRKGLEHIALRLEDIIFFYTEHKLVFVIDRTGKKYLADKTLTELEEILDNNVFFRANRQYIININFIKGFKTFEKVKLQVDLMVPDLNHCIIVSQENSPQFKEWIFNA